MVVSRDCYSIVVPTRDRPKQLGRCLQAIAALDFPRDRFEVVVVDDGSAFSPEDKVGRFRGEIKLTLVHQENLGPAGARNTGAAHATGDSLVFTDDDCEPEPRWLSAIDAAFRSHDRAMVGGRIVNRLRDNPFSAASQQLVSFLYEYYGETHPSRFFCTNNLAVDARSFCALGGFETTFRRPAAEDRDFCERWSEEGYKMIYEPKAVVHHTHNMRLGGFLRQHLRYGEGAFQLNQLRKRRGKRGLRLEPLAFYLELLQTPFTAGQSRHPYQEQGLLALSQLAGVVGFGRAACRTEAARQLPAGQGSRRTSPKE